MELWGWGWTVMFELVVILALVIGLGLVGAIVIETFRRRFNHAHLEAHPIFEDPNSFKQVQCPYIYDPAEKYISLIIPAFNEEYRLPAALDEIMTYLQKRSRKDQSFSFEVVSNIRAKTRVDVVLTVVDIELQIMHCNKSISRLMKHGTAFNVEFVLSKNGIAAKQVIIVDDGSSDGTKKVAFDFVRKYKVDNVRVVVLGKNQGKGEAIRKGVLHSRGELLLMLDADGATKVDDLEKLENQILAVAKTERQAASDSSKGIADIPIVAFGSRAHLEKKALATRKWYRNFLMKGFHLVVLLAAGPGVRDTQCGFKMFTRAAARKLFTNIRLKRWCFDVELVYLCKYFHIPILEISVNWSEIPGSKVNPLSILNMLWELALMSLGYRTGIWNITTRAS